MSEHADGIPETARADLLEVLESAARLQLAVPDAVLVGGTAAALWAGHRTSTDHDHALLDLRDRFSDVLEAIEATDGWVTNRIVPGKVILGELGGIESGVRQLVRTRPLEFTRVALPSGHSVSVPTYEETLRIKAYLVVRRNQVRDFLDVAALTQRLGVSPSARVLEQIDQYYNDQRGPDAQGVATQLARQLADPRPADPWTTRQLGSYKDVDERWSSWQSIKGICRALAVEMTR
ncbi:MAG: nucleotidyl transferase AbiEii/AbiGii toxin family protein [Candidatus Dormibacteria bacterium]